MNFQHFLEMLEIMFQHFRKMLEFIASKMLEIKSRHLTWGGPNRWPLSRKVQHDFFWSYLLHCGISSMYLIILVTRTENNLWSSTSSSQEWQMRCSKVFQSLIHHGISQSWCKHAREASKELVAVLLLTQSGKINKNVLFSDVF